MLTTYGKDGVERSGPMPNYITITGEEAASLVQSRHLEFAKEVDFFRDEYKNEDGDSVVRLYTGDTVFDGNFAVGSDTVLVDGNLSVQGLLSDCEESDHTLLVVLGNVTARDILSAGEMSIRGNVLVERLVYLNSLNDYRFLVGGDLTAEALAEDGMFTWIHGEIHAKRVLSLHNEIKQGVGAAQTRFVQRRASSPRDFFLPEFLADDYPDIGEIGHAQKQGKIVLR